MIQRLFAEQGVPYNEVTGPSRRPVFVEVALGTFAGEETGGEDNE